MDIRKEHVKGNLNMNSASIPHHAKQGCTDSTELAEVLVQVAPIFRKRRDGLNGSTETR